MKPAAFLLLLLLLVCPTPVESKPQPISLQVPLKTLSGEHANIHFSTLVPTALALEVQDHLELTAKLVQEQLGIKAPSDLPDLYLLGNDLQFRMASPYTTTLPNGASGLFVVTDAGPKMYVKADYTTAAVLKFAAHEYTHFLIDHHAKGRFPPAWLNEGLATYFSWQAGLAGKNPYPAFQILRFRAGQTRLASERGRLPRLEDLEAYDDWIPLPHSRRAVALNYSRSTMTVQYLAETFGMQAVERILTATAAGMDTGDAVQSVTGISYDRLQDDMASWLRSWQHPESDRFPDGRMHWEMLREAAERSLAGLARDLAHNQPLAVTLWKKLVGKG